MAFSSSRTLPGQRWAARRRLASDDSGFSATPLAAEYFLMKNSAITSTSPGRSRSEGMRRFTTFRR
jgi:hypothetical protein